MRKPQLLTIGHSYVVALNRSVMRGLQRRGVIDVTVLAPRYFSGDLRPIEIEPEPVGSSLSVVPIDCYLTQKIHVFFYNPKQLSAVFTQKKWDFGYLWEEPYILSGYQTAKKLSEMNIPFSIFTNQNIFKKYPWPFSYFEKSTLAKCDSLWGCGPQVIETFNKKKYTGSSEVIPYFVNTDFFKPYSAEGKKQKKLSMGLNPSPVIGFMGRLTEEKGCKLFMNVIDRLPLDLDWQVLILGSGPMEQEIKQWILRKSLQQRVFVRLVAHDEVPKILPVMDLILCPSQTTSFWREQFGRMIIEAFASGVPVLASDSGEIPYVVGNAGRILPEKDEEQWFNSLREILADSNLWQKMRDEGLKRAELFSINSIAEKIEKIVLARLS